MKAMLGLVAVVAIIATTGAIVPEYSVDNVSTYNSAPKDGEVTKAEFLNPEAKLKFKVRDTPEEDGVILILDPSPDSTGIAKDGRGKSLKVHFTNIGETFCNIRYFILLVESFHNAETGAFLGEVPQLVAYFDNNGKKFAIETSIFKVPSELASADKEELQSWATANKVGIDSPVYNEMLSNISEKGEWKGDFKWLSDLISYGIIKSIDSHDDMAYTARPMVWSAETIDKFIQVVDKYKKKPE